jgi:hypothetical protein
MTTARVDCSGGNETLGALRWRFRIGAVLFSTLRSAVRNAAFSARASTDVTPRRLIYLTFLSPGRSDQVLNFSSSNIDSVIGRSANQLRLFLKKIRERPLVCDRPTSTHMTAAG